MGADATGKSYLPNGETLEGKMNYEPSVLPVAVGGYYWVLFTSRRTYGNTISPTSGDPPGNDPFGTEANPSPRKKVWIAAIDIDHPGKLDPSHPAFYLPGQELRTANMRAFAALAPCQQNGVSCETGADCCGGYCREVVALRRRRPGVCSACRLPPTPARSSPSRAKRPRIAATRRTFASTTAAPRRRSFPEPRLEPALVFSPRRRVSARA